MGNKAIALAGFCQKLAFGMTAISQRRVATGYGSQNPRSSGIGQNDWQSQGQRGAHRVRTRTAAMV
ncbi:hypothetical protein C7W88_21380 (plasmid) [Novosphingobium sp. THN1]|jgi:hypothetical protein|uniref:hypothetical protein n=1 Tax=unclassified Novosphingobium TaxID=2644732 RepID=UPI000E4902C6|nr:MULTISPECIES: hypothetical protein [unclassified Novosphingobium]AXU21415.1 hypothetical protein C7W88_21380 [Novosphingobium sp. THN1]NLR40648.1 hypothetical protein [Novosphingobium sp. ERW19]